MLKLTSSKSLFILFLLTSIFVFINGTHQKLYAQNTNNAIINVDQQNDNIDRIILSFDQPMKLVHRKRDNNIIILFEQPIMGDIADISSKSRFISQAQLQQNNRLLLLTKKGESTYRLTQDNGEVLIDINAIKTPINSINKANITFNNSPNIARIRLNFERKPNFAYRPKDNNIILLFDQPFEANINDITTRLSHLIRQTTQLQNGRLLVISLKEQYLTNIDKDGNDVLINITLPENNQGENTQLQNQAKIFKTQAINTQTNTDEATTDNQLSDNSPSQTTDVTSPDDQSVSEKYDLNVQNPDDQPLKQIKKDDISLISEYIDDGHIRVKITGLKRRSFIKNLKDGKATIRLAEPIDFNLDNFDDSQSKILKSFESKSEQKRTNLSFLVQDQTDFNVSVRGKEIWIDFENIPSSDSNIETNIVTENNNEDIETVNSRIPTTDAVFSMIFNNSSSGGAAVFHRNNRLWVVLDLVPRDFASEEEFRKSNGNIVDLKTHADTENFVISMLLRNDLKPVPKIVGNNWVLDFYDEDVKVQENIEISANLNDNKSEEIIFKNVGITNNVIYFDPVDKETYLIRTVKIPGLGVNADRRFLEFDIYRSYQGIVVNSFVDYISLAALDDNNAIVTSQQGLILSFSDDGGPAYDDQLLTLRILPFADWQQSGQPFTVANQFLQNAVAAEAASGKDFARLQLARFYASHAMGAETIAVLKQIEASSPNLKSNVDIKALSGVADSLLERYDEAREKFTDPRLSLYSEISIWRAYIFAQTNQWERAERFFSQGDEILRNYPYPIKGRLALVRMRSLVQNQKYNELQKWYEELNDEKEQLTDTEKKILLNFEATLMAINDNIQRAVSIWNNLINDENLYVSSRAAFAKLNTMLALELINVDQSLEELENLRYVWRGDLFELEILSRLGEVYAQAGEFDKSLNTLNTAKKYFQQYSAAETIGDRMDKIFADIYLRGGIKDMPILSALAIFHEFRDLVPENNTGDAMIETLTNYLINVDLLDQASDIMNHQIRNRLKGEEKARIGTKMAIINLMSRKPEQTLETLNISQYINMSETLKDDRRHIRAKALIDLRSYDSAIKLLAGDVSFNADLLRRDIFWARKQWPEAAQVMQRLAGSPPDSNAQLNNFQARAVLNWGVALRLNNDLEGLTEIAKFYGKAMARTNFNDLFAFISQDIDDNSNKDFQNILTSLSQQSDFDVFLQEYKNRYIDNSLVGISNPDALIQKLQR